MAVDRSCTAGIAGSTCSTAGNRGNWNSCCFHIHSARQHKAEVEQLSGETVRRRLAENDLKLWRKDMWCIRASGLQLIRASTREW